MIKSGTTSFLECMLAEVYGFDGVAETLIQSGMRAAIGKIVMDKPSYAGARDVMHPGLIEDGETCINNTLTAFDKWNGAGDGRIVNDQRDAFDHGLHGRTAVRHADLWLPICNQSQPVQ